MVIHILMISTALIFYVRPVCDLILDVQAGPAVPKTSMYVYGCVHLYKYLNSLALHVRLGMAEYLTI